MSSSFCPSVAGTQPHNFQPYFDLRTLSSVAICTFCGDQVEILPNAPAAPSPTGFVLNVGGLGPQMPSGGQPSTGGGSIL